MDGDGLLSGGSSGPWGRFPAYLASSGSDVEGVHAGISTGQASAHNVGASSSKSDGEGYNVPTTSTSVGSRADSPSPPTSTSATVPSSQTTGVLPENVGATHSRINKLLLCGNGRQGSSLSNSSDETDSTDSGKSSKKHPWTADEDEALRLLVQKHGARDWGKIAAHLPNRNGKQCHQRWNYFLNPDVRKGLWSDEEDRNIMYWQRLIGNKWAKIAGYLPGRTGHAVKNRYHQMSNGQKRRRSSSLSSSCAAGGGSMASQDMGKMWPKHSPSSSMHVPHGSHHAAPASASSGQHHLESYMGSVPPQAPPQSASVPVLMGSAQSQASDMHSQQYQMPPLASQQMQSTHMHNTHQQLLEQHQHETLKYPWQDHDDCPVGAYQYHASQAPQGNQQGPEARMHMGQEAMGMYGGPAPSKSQLMSLQSSGMNSQTYYRPDDMDVYYQQPYPMVSAGPQLQVQSMGHPAQHHPQQGSGVQPSGPVNGYSGGSGMGPMSHYQHMVGF